MSIIQYKSWREWGESDRLLQNKFIKSQTFQRIENAMKTLYLQAIVTASVGGILYGYDMGIISGSLPLLSSYFQLTPSAEDWIVSLLYFGGGVGAATGGFICDWLGRKFAILITDVSGFELFFQVYSANFI